MISRLLVLAVGLSLTGPAAAETFHDACVAAVAERFGVVELIDQVSTDRALTGEEWSALASALGHGESEITFGEQQVANGARQPRLLMLQWQAKGAELSPDQVVNCSVVDDIGNLEDFAPSSVLVDGETNQAYLLRSISGAE